jgi:predicted NAD/FAD-dependent oxidoreductase
MVTGDPQRVAIVGGGITGAVAAAALAPHFSVSVFDQGRRGPGGRASHRSVRSTDQAVLPDDVPPPQGATDTYEFDHGCQFTRADDPAMQELVDGWVRNGWAERWAGQFGCITADGAADDNRDVEGDFFGLPSSGSPVYVGVGGMHLLPRRILAQSGATVHAGVRIGGVQRLDSGQYELLGVGGEAAFHDTTEAFAAGARADTRGTFDAVLFTDISSSFDEWHRASAGVPEAIASRVRQRVRVPLFSCMVALEWPVADAVQLDAITVRDSDVLWFAARSQSKPGVCTGAAECWTLVSTASYAAKEVGRELMQDATTLAFKPQTNEYLNSVPGPALLAAFERAIRPLLVKAGKPMPGALYLQAQRWGSALPATSGVGGRDVHGFSAVTSVEVLGVRYESAMPPLLPARAAGAARDGVTDDAASDPPADDFVALDAGTRVYYAGDFCSRRTPGFEAAALSALDVARHMRTALGRSVPV